MLATGADTGWVAHAVGVATLAGSFNEPVKHRGARILEPQFGRLRLRTRPHLGDADLRQSDPVTAVPRGSPFGTASPGTAVARPVPRREVWA